MKGIVIAGKYGEVLIRQKQGSRLEVGEMLIAKQSEGKILLQITDLLYGSQISQSNLEFISGMKVEQGEQINFMEEELSNYTLAVAKSILFINQKGTVKPAKMLPDFFGEVDEICADDFSFLEKPDDAIFLGFLRSGSKVLDVPIYLNGKDVLSHHVLIPATTGRGKSNLLSVLLHDATAKKFCGTLVLDPHDEYHDRLRHLSDVLYYSTCGKQGSSSLKFNISLLRPHHFQGTLNLSGPQRDALYVYYRTFGDAWVTALLQEQQISGGFHDSTLAVLGRKISNLLDIQVVSYNDGDKRLSFHGVFTDTGALSTIKDICRYLESGQCVIVNTSLFYGGLEILIGSLITTEIFDMYKYYNRTNVLNQKPVVSIVLEEAPRVLGKEVLEQGPNIFSTIAREGRKFKIGLIAVTQLPSLIPRTILANMNTKIILGIEMGPERSAIIESASQDLSSDGRSIAALDKGEAIISSNFGKFAIPVKIPLFSAYATSKKNADPVRQSFTGVRLS